MRGSARALHSAVGGGLAALLVLFAAAAVAGVTDGAVGYADLAPILQSRCVVCHSGASAPLGLRLDSLAALLEGSRNGPVVKAGEPRASELIRRLKGLSQPRMPMTGPPFLDDAEIARFERWIAASLPAGAEAAAPAAAAAARPQPGDAVTYAQVAPIFARRCAKCHTDQGLMGPAPEGFRLTSYAATLSAADRVRVVPGNAAASELMRRLRGQALPRMPYDGPPYLADEEIALISAWIEQGARDAEGRPAALPAGAPLRLHGTLGGGWNLDGLDLAVGASTRLDKRPASGDYVEVRGHLDDAGRVVAERIRRR